MNAPEILSVANRCIHDRGTERDQENGERSMERTVKCFNALMGTDLTTKQGWFFMALLKAARATAGNHRLDDYVDGAAYFALAGEQAEVDDADKKTKASF